MDELCRRVAAGVPGAREEFSERMAPLMELLAKRSIAGSRDSIRPPRSVGAGDLADSGGSHGDAAAGHSGKIARLSERFCRSVIDKVRRQHRQPGAETCAVRPPWPTKRGGIFRS